MKAEIILSNKTVLMIYDKEVEYFMSQMNMYPEKFLELTDEQGKIMCINKEYVIGMFEL